VAPSWPLIMGFIAFLPGLRAPTAILGDPDTYFHVTVGRWILAHRALPIADPFSHSMAGAAWLTHEWLGEVAMALAYDAGGWRLVVLLTASCFAASVGLLTRLLLRRCEPVLALILSFAAYNLFLPHLLARPHVLVLPVMVAFCGAIFAARDSRRGPPFKALPLMILWANIHGSYALGLVLAACLGAEAVAFPAKGVRPRAEARRWGAFLLLATAASLITPNGLEGFLPVVRMLRISVAQSYIAEWRSADFSHIGSLELWILGAILVGFTMGIRLPIFRLLFVLAFVHLALVHTRHDDLLGFIAPLAVIGSLGPQIAERMRGPSGRRLTESLTLLARPASWTAAALVSLVALALSFAAMPRPIERRDEVATPSSALAAARRLGLEGPVFNTQAFGGYLIFEGVPVIGDGRLEMYGNDFLARYFAAIDGREPALAQLLARYDVKWTLLRPGEGAVSVLDSSPNWHRVYTDPWAVIHVRSAPGG